MTATGSYLQFDAALVEETVLLSMSGHSEERQFRQARDRIYLVQDADDKEKRFQEFHHEWFERLQLHLPFTAALAEHPVLFEKTRLCAVTPAVSRKDEAADLHGVTDQRQPSLIIRLRPATIFIKDTLMRFLRHELTCVTDMLDPRFLYEPSLPVSGFGPSHDNLIRERYIVLRDTWISGRLERRGWFGPEIRSKRWNEFAKAFAFLGAEAEKVFINVYESDAQTHAALVDLASAPPSAGGSRTCPLCRFPASRLLKAALPAVVQAEIETNHPGWQPGDGLCAQCADLYAERVKVSS